MGVSFSLDLARSAMDRAFFPKHGVNSSHSLDATPQDQHDMRNPVRCTC
jgi:hypothetical protein